MKNIKNISVIGAGAVGMLYANIMSKHIPSENLRMVANTERLQRYNKAPFTVNGEECTFKFVDSKEKVEPADLLIIVTKSLTLEDAINDCKNHINENTIIMSLLNGIISEQILEKKYPGQVVYSVALGMDATRVGQDLFYTVPGIIQFGEKNGEISERVKAIDEVFTACGVPHEVHTDILYKQWKKLMFNVGLNQSCAINGVTYSGVQVAGEPRTHMIEGMKEVQFIATKEGINLTEEDFKYWLDMVPTFNGDGMPSMAQDVRAKRPTEVELFAGTIKKLGKKHNVSTPINDWFYEKIIEIESNY